MNTQSYSCSTKAIAQLAPPPPPPEKRIILSIDLSITDACALRRITGRISGCPVSTPRAVADVIHKALDHAGIHYELAEATIPSGTLEGNITFKPLKA